ncbi:hypothetical protein BKA80DRAFT_61588 [Phyllosticta citrichinensis]
MMYKVFPPRLPGPHSLGSCRPVSSSAGLANSRQEPGHVPTCLPACLPAYLPSQGRILVYYARVHTSRSVSGEWHDVCLRNTE